MSTHRTKTSHSEPVGRDRRSVSILAALTLAVILAGPHLAIATRAVVNLPVSVVAVVWARAHGGSCDVHPDLLVTCGSMRGGYSIAGTTVGNVWLYGDQHGVDRQRHEARHSDQWAVFGPAFPALYGADWAHAGGDPQRSVFEQWAGLHDGHYRR